MVFASALDEGIFAGGPPAVFTVDPRGRLRVDPERTRELYLRIGVPEGRDPGVFVHTDGRTGVRMVLATNHAALAAASGTVERAPDLASALARVRDQWRAPAEAGPAEQA
jgi:hypothetical protein